MIWKVLTNILRGAVLINKTVTAVGAATIIAIGVYDYVRNQRRDQ